mgnify:CR=1 FL=1
MLGVMYYQVLGNSPIDKYDLIFATMIPDFPVSTADARRVLPDSYTRKDMVFNASRAALLVASMMTGNMKTLTWLWRIACISLIVHS